MPEFGGPRLEARHGYARSQTGLVRFGFDGEARSSASSDGLLYGVGAGYDVALRGRLSRVVLGVEAGVDWTDLETDLVFRNFGELGDLRGPMTSAGKSKPVAGSACVWVDR